MDEILENGLDISSGEVSVEEMPEVVNEDIVVEELEIEDVTELMQQEYVSGGDSVGDGGTQAYETPAQTLSIDGATVYVAQEYTLLGENAKPLEDYSVTEGLLFLIFLVLLAGTVLKVIGGVLNCSMLFKK